MRRQALAGTQGPPAACMWRPGWILRRANLRTRACGLRVSDNGAGHRKAMPADRVFEPFFTTQA